MTQVHDYRSLMETSLRVNWRIDEIIGGDRRMDFSRPFLPESFARTQALGFLTPSEQLTLNHVRAHNYLAMFELVERCILPVIEAVTHDRTEGDPWRAPALQQFAAEEEKHIQLFVTFREEFTRDFGQECRFIGPAEDIGSAIRAHSPLGLALFVLGIEWATQRHYVESVKDDQALDPQFQSLLKHHWLEESQHAKLDALVFQEMASRSDVAGLDRAVDDFLDIGGFVDAGLKQQAIFDLESLESAIGRTLPAKHREMFVVQQHQAMRWTFLGSAMVNRGFLDTLGEVNPAARARIEAVAPAFC